MVMMRTLLLTLAIGLMTTPIAAADDELPIRVAMPPLEPQGVALDCHGIDQVAVCLYESNACVTVGESQACTPPYQGPICHWEGQGGLNGELPAGWDVIERGFGVDGDLQQDPSGGYYAENGYKIDANPCPPPW